MGLMQIFVASFALGFSGAMAPGPMLAATVSRSAREGFWAGPLIVAGHAVLELAVVIAIAMGLGRFLKHDTVRGGIAIVGAAILLYMGAGLLRNLRRLTMNAAAQGGPSVLGSVQAGVLTSLSNPYWSIWWAGSGLAAYVKLVGDSGLTGAAYFFTGHILSDLVWFSLVSLLVTLGRRQGNGRGLINDRLYQGMMAVCGLTLIGFGVWFAWSGCQWLSAAMRA